MLVSHQSTHWCPDRVADQLADRVAHQGTDRRSKRSADQSADRHTPNKRRFISHV